MELKKSPKADLTRKTGFFFSIGLLVTMSIVLMAFEWKQHESKIAELAQRNVDTIDDMNVVSTQILPPPPPVIVKVPIIIEVDDTEEVEESEPFVPFDISQEILPVVATPVVVDEPEDTEAIIVFVESPASFDGGFDAFYSLVGKEIKYPAQARRMGIEGKVFVEFVVNKDGSLVDVKAIKGIGGGCDEEAVRVIRNSPRWNPGKQRGKAVRQRMVLPVNFALSHN